MSGHGITGRSARLIDVREVVKLDIAMHGKRFILAEFALASLLFWPLALVMASVGFFYGRHPVGLAIGGLFLLGCALSSSTFLLLALRVVRTGEDVRVMPRPRNPGTLTLIVAALFLVPLALPLLAAYQAVSRPKVS